MKNNRKEKILVTGNGKLACSVSVCLGQAGHEVCLHTKKAPAAEALVKMHLEDLRVRGRSGTAAGPVVITEQSPHGEEFDLAVVLSGDDPAVKKEIIGRLEKEYSREMIIAVNTENVPLSSLQAVAASPERIIGLNWAEPAHTTFFLEIIRGGDTSDHTAGTLLRLAGTGWNKDPYVIQGDLGVRTKLVGALVREAFYLVENGYATVEDVDRACRNDAGYYLPFAGNFRYMDLMGASAYGMVMKELNKELSKARSVPGFFEALIREGALGMENGRGFYEYGKEEAERWQEWARQFSYEILELMEKYPFGYDDESGAGKSRL